MVILDNIHVGRYNDKECHYNIDHVLNKTNVVIYKDHKTNSKTYPTLSLLNDFTLAYKLTKK